MSFGLDASTLTAIDSCLRSFPEIEWAKIYGSRAMGNFERGSDIDLAYSAKRDCSADLLEALDSLPTPYLFDVTHYPTLAHVRLREHIDRVGIEIYRREDGVAGV